ncbi:neutral zinc metallopeptidase [Inhella sp.]|uniref:KPN_02809 family neutral zinc metallopeptidase n=1 Tax=Inhella sp. TaxID=1921806 RepID=UPI0035AE01CE
MKWEGHRQSERIEDLRGGGGRPRVGGRGLGLGGIVIALLAAWIFGVNPMTVLGLMGGGGAPGAQSEPGRPLAAQTESERFVATVLADTEDVWAAYFKTRQPAVGYAPPTLALFREPVQTACGRGEAAMGPFYCPGDEKVYLDLGFFETLQSRLGAPGDFAQAYVIAHEVGHHLQQRLGISAKVQQARQRVSEAQGNQLSVRLELQADCLAGVWAHHSQQGKGWLEQGDVEEALNAASRIGDDVLQKAARGVVVPESFTHGSAAQRQRWFRAGLQQGALAACDTFAARTL